MHNFTFSFSCHLVEASFDFLNLSPAIYKDITIWRDPRNVATNTNSNRTSELTTILCCASEGMLVALANAALADAALADEAAARSEERRVGKEC